MTLNKINKNMINGLPEELNSLTEQLADIAINVKNFGAVGDGITDDRKAIQDAIDYASTLPNGASVLLPDGYTFLLGSFSIVTSYNYVLKLKNKVSIIGRGTLKIKDGLGDYHTLLFANEDISDVAFKDFTIDENTIGNPMINLPNGTNGNYRCTINMWNHAYKNITIENVVIKDCVGVWQITTGKIENFNFRNNKIFYTGIVPSISYDRTSLYYGGVGGEVAGNLFKGAPFANTAIELHGKNVSCYGNIIEQYGGSIFIVNDAEIIDVLTGVNVTDNILQNVKSGITLWCEGTRPIKGVKINNNNIKISPTRGGIVADNGITSSGIAFYPTWGSGDIQDVEITNNTLHFDLTTVQPGSTQIPGISIPKFTGVASYSLQNLKIKNNSIVNPLHAGIRVEPNQADSVIVGLEIADNTIINAGQFTSTGGVQLVGVPKFIACIVKNNKLIEKRSPAISTNVVQYFNVANDDGVNNLQLVDNEVFITDETFTSFADSELSKYIVTNGAFLKMNFPNISNKKITHNARVGSILEDSKTGRIYKQITSPKGNKWVSTSYASAQPSQGFFEKGDTIYNTEPSASGSMGWIVTAGGNACSVDWVASTVYNVGDQVRSSGAVYQCVVAGTSGTTAPTGTGLNKADGTVSWNFLSWLPVFKTFGTISS